MKVLIVGAGLGGLCLAQGLRRQKIAVTVMESDVGPEARKQGYRLNINVTGANALAVCLPSPLLHLYRATSHRQLDPAVTVYTPSFEQISQRLADVGDCPVPPSAVDRATLREILAVGLTDAIEYGKPVTAVGSVADSGYAVCADGSTSEGDLVVAADGVRSVVRRALLPGADPTDIGIAAIYGRTPLTPEVRAFLPKPVLTGRLTGLVDGAGLMLALGAWDPRNADLVGARPYLMWVVIGSPDLLGVAGDDPAALHRRACLLIADWDAGVRQAVQAAQVPDTFLVGIRCSPSIPQWTSGRITFLGDAIHTMTPAGGEGANTAMRDAAALVGKLGLVKAGRLSFQQAIAEDEAQLRTVGNDAIFRSQHYGTSRS
jgi:salicylate hydroxylase